jgi:hypothetical protein
LWTFRGFIVDCSMPNAFAGMNQASLMHQAASMQREILHMQEKLNAFLRSAKGLMVVLPELHERSTGKIDARKIADFLGIPLKQLAESLGLSYKAMHRNPAATSFQETLRPVKRVLELLHEFYPDPEAARVWLNTPHPDLDGRTALEAILQGRIHAILTILENASAGVPV